MHNRLAGVVGSIAVMTAVGGCSFPGSATGPVTQTIPATPRAATKGTPGAAAKATTAPTLSVVALGDSVVSGEGCDCTYVSEYAAGLGASEGAAVRTVNFGQGGETAAGLADRLRSETHMRTEVAAADIVLITVGANDLWGAHDTWQEKGGCDTTCYQPEVDTMAVALKDVLTQVRTIDGRPGPQILVTNYWNVFEAGEIARQTYGEGFLEWTDEVTRAANTAICDEATKQQVRCVDVDSAFVGQGADPTPLLAEDGDHPNAAGTALIARVLLAATTKP